MSSEGPNKERSVSYQDATEAYYNELQTLLPRHKQVLNSVKDTLFYILKNALSSNANVSGRLTADVNALSKVIDDIKNLLDQTTHTFDAMFVVYADQASSNYAKTQLDTQKYPEFEYKRDELLRLREELLAWNAFFAGIYKIANKVKNDAKFKNPNGHFHTAVYKDWLKKKTYDFFSRDDDLKSDLWSYLNHGSKMNYLELMQHFFALIVLQQKIGKAKSYDTTLVDLFAFLPNIKAQEDDTVITFLEHAYSVVWAQGEVNNLLVLHRQIQKSIKALNGARTLSGLFNKKSKIHEDINQLTQGKRQLSATIEYLQRLQKLGKLTPIMQGDLKGLKEDLDKIDTNIVLVTDLESQYFDEKIANNFFKFLENGILNYIASLTNTILLLIVEFMHATVGNSQNDKLVKDARRRLGVLIHEADILYHTIVSDGAKSLMQSNLFFDFIEKFDPEFYNLFNTYTDEELERLQPILQMYHKQYMGQIKLMGQYIYYARSCINTFCIEDKKIFVDNLNKAISNFLVFLEAKSRKNKDDYLRSILFDYKLEFLALLLADVEKLSLNIIRQNESNVQKVISSIKKLLRTVKNGSNNDIPRSLMQMVLWPIQD